MIHRFQFPVLEAVVLASAFYTCTADYGAQEPGRVAPLVRVEASDEAMGTTFSVVLYGADRTELDRAARAALDEAIRLDNLLSNYKADSEWSAMNRAAGLVPVAVSRELFDLLTACLAYSRASDGAFDITVGPLIKTWRFFKDEGALPDVDAIALSRTNVGYQHIRLDPTRSEVRFDRKGLELDPGAIGKGYAVDRMVSVLDRRGVTTAFVSAGGSSIYGRGTPPEEPRGWPVTIRAPGGSVEDAAQVFLKDASLSTSGSHEKFFRAGGRVYSHILDPRTGYPATGVSSVSVVAPRAIDSEAWATAIFVNGRAWTVERRPAGFRVLMCNDSAPAACHWIE